MTINDFINKWNGKQAPDNHGGYVGECVSLAKRYAQEVQGLDGDYVLYAPGGSAKSIWLQATPQMKEQYDMINPDQPRLVGDLIIWGYGTYGDIAIVNNIDKQVFGQLGTPVFKPAGLRNDNSTPVLGYLRKKGTDVKSPYPDKGNLINYYNSQGWPGHPISDDDVAYWCYGTGNEWWGNVHDVWWNLGNQVANYAKTHVNPSDFEATNVTQDGKQLFKEKN